MILAGGRSQRFGRDKALADWYGSTFLEQVHGTLVDAADTVRVLAREDHAVRYVELVPDAEIRTDPEPFEGPVAALRAGLPDAETVVLASVDAPGLRRSHVRQLLDVGQDRLAVAVNDGDRLHTLLAGPRACLSRRIASGARMRDLTAGAYRVRLFGAGLNVNRQTEVAVGAR